MPVNLAPAGMLGHGAEEEEYLLEVKSLLFVESSLQVVCEEGRGGVELRMHSHAGKRGGAHCKYLNEFVHRKLRHSILLTSI